MRLAQVVLFAAIVLGTSAVAPAVYGEAKAQEADIGEKVPGAERLEGRLLAPCCWSQTLDIHGSEIANELRHEIRTRLKAGESPDAIEKSLVARYGRRILAVPDDVPLDEMGTLGWFGVAAAAGFLGYVLWTWRNRGARTATKSRTATSDSQPGERGAAEASDERLEAELHRMDET